MQLKRIDSFTLNKRNFVYFDLGRIQSNAEFEEFMCRGKEFMQIYEPKSVYSITNVEGLMYDSETKKLIMEWLTFNAKYVIQGVVIHMDGMKKITFGGIIKAAKRENLVYFNTRQEAIDYLSQV